MKPEDIVVGGYYKEKFTLYVSKVIWVKGQQIMMNVYDEKGKLVHADCRDNVYSFVAYHQLRVKPRLL